MIIGFVIFFGITSFIFFGNSCGIDHMFILNQINSYEKSLDPEICEEIDEKIDLFNDECKPQMEILDCG